MANKLPLETRVQILNLLVEGNSMRSVSRLCDVSINTVAKMLVEAGEACLGLHDEKVRGVKAQRVQCDEIWSFCYAKNKNVAQDWRAVSDVTMIDAEKHGRDAIIADSIHS